MRLALGFLLAFSLGCSSKPAVEFASRASAEQTPANAAKAANVKPTREGSDWNRFLGPTGDNVSTEKGILTTWPKDGLKKLWDCPLGIGYAPPTVAAGRLFHFDLQPTANRDRSLGVVSCRNAETGELLWTFEYRTEYRDNYGYEGSRCCPIVDGERVYVYGPEGMLFCLNVSDGKEIWKLNTKEKYRFHQNFFGVGSCPLVEGDLLLIAVGGSPRTPRPSDFRQVKPNGTAIVALDKKTGEVKYEAGDELASYSSPFVATVNNRRLGFYFARGGLLAFDPATGKTDFHFPWRAKIEESVNVANPVMIGNNILISESYELGAAYLKLEPGKATEIWTDKTRDREEKALMNHWNTPIHHEGYIYGSSGRHSNEADLRCVELATGKIMWSVKLTTRCTLLKVDGHLISLGEQGELRLIKPNPMKYEELAKWECQDLNYPAWAPPVLSRGLMYVRGKDRLLCLELIPKK